ncbi:hypothetical protein CGZ80_20265 [Rhodopirellula sp. MGV]|nr:hypothetical protein CGZ80_20265 [Rhodopirellula sp. MGV]PNY38011.1 hypothetical protein C2E31_04850 [Rhodopirellula baltica]
MLNPYEPITDNAAESLSDDSRTGTRYFRLRVLPTGLSWLFGLLLLTGFVFWIVQMFISNADHPLDTSLWLLTIGIASSLLISSGLNLLAGVRWIKMRWRSALALNLASWLLMYVSTNRMQTFMDAQ